MILKVSDELRRKTLEALETFALRHEQGVLSDREFLLVTDAVWQSAGGLVDGLSDLMGDVAALKLENRTGWRIITDGKESFALRRNGRNVVSRNTRTGNVVSDTLFDTEADAVDHINKQVAVMGQIGFKEL